MLCYFTCYCYAREAWPGASCCPSVGGECGSSGRSGTQPQCITQLVILFVVHTMNYVVSPAWEKINLLSSKEFIPGVIFSLRRTGAGQRRPGSLLCLISGIWWVMTIISWPRGGATAGPWRSTNAAGTITKGHFPSPLH